MWDLPILTCLMLEHGNGREEKRRKDTHIYTPPTHTQNEKKLTKDLVH
jgi:hypothetical protein